MSFVLTVGQRSPGEEQAGELLIRKSRGLSVVDSPRDLVVLKGEVFDHTPQQTADLLCTNAVTALPRLSGEFSVVRYSKDDGLVWFATDRLGREPLFFCIDGGCLIVSDDFWEVVNVINPSGSSIDVQAVKESLLFHYPLFDGTIVRGVRFLQPSTVGEFSCAGQTLRQWRYWDLRYCPDMSVSEDTAVERLDASLHAAFAQIAALNPGRSYGVGVSGGLDSRVTPYYALKHSMPLKSFIIGQRTPHRFWLSRDHRSARDVASYYGLTHSEVEWDSDTFDDKMLRDARFYPMGGSQFFIAVSRAVPDFDVLLTGASGMIVGAEVPPSIMTMNRDELTGAITKHCCQVRMAPRLRRRVATVASEYLGLNMTVKEGKPAWLDSLVTQEEYDLCTEKFRGFVEQRLDQGKSNLDVYQDYFMFFLRNKNKLGAFESLQGMRKSYSMWAPFLLQEPLTWKPEFLLKRRLLKRLIARKMPKLAEVKPQGCYVSIADESKGRFKKVLALVEALIRGDGVGLCESWARSKKYREYASHVLSLQSETFSGIFERTCVQGILKENPWVFEKLLKIKYLLHLIDTRRYRDFVDRCPEASWRLLAQSTPLRDPWEHTTSGSQEEDGGK